MKEIELTQGKVAIVDDEDFEYLSEWNWCAVYDPSSKSYRAYTNDYSKKLCGVRSVFMHRYVMGFPSLFQIDHINHDTLDNRKENLRVATPSQNCRNTRSHKDSSSIYKGVRCKYSKGKYARWEMNIFSEGKRISHYFGSEIEAARAYDKKARELFGEFACLNFPDDAQ
jgi:hypothetical protein